MFGNMTRSLRIFTWLGIPVYLHWSFFLIFLYALYIGWSENMTPGSIVWLMVYFIAMFGCVLLHEYGHSLAARRYGVRTHDIILTPLGGMARLTHIPEKPVQEFIVAIAGPLVNVVIAAILYAFGTLYFSGESELAFAKHMSQPVLDTQNLYAFVPLVIWTNLSLFVFNLLPAFPMDGGRILRSLLSMKFGRVNATKYAVWVGQVLAIFFIIAGLYSQNIILAIIGFFVITTARAEYHHVRNAAMLRSSTASNLVRYQFTRLYLNDWVQSAYDILSHGHERAFLVYNLEGRPVGVLAESDIYLAKNTNSMATPVGQWMNHQIHSVTLDTEVEKVQAYLSQSDIYLIVVTEPATGNIVGVIDDLGLELFIERQAREMRV